MEHATFQFAEKLPLTPKLLSETFTISTAISFLNLTPSEAILKFNTSLREAIRFRSFQKAEDVADGLSYIWAEKNKWDKISTKLGLQAKKARAKQNAIVARRNIIAHAADFDGFNNTKFRVSDEEAIEVIRFTRQLADAIEQVIAEAS